MTETGAIILNWLKEEFPKSEWTLKENSYFSYSTNTQVVSECMSANIGGITLELKVSKDLAVEIWTKTPFKKSSKVREVHLQDPTSIDDLQEVVKHTIKITTNPYL